MPYFEWATSPRGAPDRHTHIAQQCRQEEAPAPPTPWPQPHLPLIIEARGAGAAWGSVTPVEQHAVTLLNQLVLTQGNLLHVTTGVLRSNATAAAARNTSRQVYRPGCSDCCLQQLAQGSEIHVETGIYNQQTPELSVVQMRQWCNARRTCQHPEVLVCLLAQPAATAFDSRRHAGMADSLSV